MNEFLAGVCNHCFPLVRWWQCHRSNEKDTTRSRISWPSYWVECAPFVLLDSNDDKFMSPMTSRKLVRRLMDVCWSVIACFLFRTGSSSDGCLLTKTLVVSCFVHNRLFVFWYMFDWLLMDDNTCTRACALMFIYKTKLNTSICSMSLPWAPSLLCRNGTLYGSVLPRLVAG